MTEFFNKIVNFIKMETLTNSEGFEPPVSLPAGMKFKVSPNFLTEEGKRNVDKDGYITVRPIDYTKD